MVRRMHIGLATVVALILILAGCGDDSGSSATPEDPSEAILAAFSDLDPSTVDMTFSLDTTGAELARTMETELSGDPREEVLLDLLAQAELQIVSSHGAMALAFAVDGSTIVELRVIGQTAYIRLDVDSVVELANQVDPEAGAELTGQIQMVPLMFGNDPSMSFLGDLLTGGWVSLEIPADSGLGDLWESSTDPETADAELAAALGQIVDENTVVTPAGEARGGDRYLVEVRVADLLAALRSHPVTAEALELADTEADLDELLAEMRDEGIAEVWEVDVVLIEGRLSSIRVDLADIATDAPEGATLPFLLTLAPSPSAPTAPSEHTPVPIELLEQLFSGYMASA